MTNRVPARRFSDCETHMPLDDAYLSDVEAKLTAASPALAEALHAALETLPDGLADAQLHLWLDEGVGLAPPPLRSWEAAADYLRAGPSLLNALDETSFRAWAQGGLTLAELASAIAGAYFRSSPA